MKFVWLVAKVGACIVLVLAAAGAGFWFWLNQAVREPHIHGNTAEIISIEPHEGTTDIAAQLRRQGVLAQEWPLLCWMKLVNRGQSLKAGDYQFQSPITPLQVLDKLIKGEVVSFRFTIPEGYNRFEIADILASLPGLKEAAADDQTVLNLLSNSQLIADLAPDATTLEGFLFPDTYEYTPRTTRNQLVGEMVDRFRKIYSAKMRQQAKSLGMTTKQVVTFASLIEKEAKVDSERELISSVYHRRLKKGMLLACDPTVVYAAILERRYRGTIYQSDLDRNSPYNTYKFVGLPPGPIASPGRRSLQAALAPADTDYLYFVVDVSHNNGSHRFSANPADHDRAVAALREWEKKHAPR